MNESEEHLRKFYEVIEDEIARRMVELEDLININLEMGDIATLKDLLVEANGLVSLVCGDDGALYETLRYRLIYNPENGDIYVFQGEEIDVDVRMWSELGDFDDEMDEDYDPDSDDDEDEGSDDVWGRIS